MANFASAGVGRSGRLHALHFDNTAYGDLPYTSALTYIRKGNGEPLISELRRGRTIKAWHADLAVDADDNVHLAFHDNGTLAYQRLQGDQMFGPVTIDHGGVGSHPSITLGGGTIHMAYFDDGEARLKYARWTCSQP